MKCANCKEEILQKNPEKCPYCGSTNLISEEDTPQNVIAETGKQKAGRYEKAASGNAKVGRISTINMECPHCGATQPLSQKTNEVTCENCRKKYVIPKKVLDLL